MKITEIQVSSGCTFNHPYEGYSNFRPGITLKATVEEGEIPEVAIRALQDMARRIVWDEKASILARLEHVEKLRQEAEEAEYKKAQGEREAQYICDRKGCDHRRVTHNGPLGECMAVGCPCMEFEEPMPF